MEIIFKIKDVGENVEFTTKGDMDVCAVGEKPTPAQTAAKKIRELINLMVESASQDAQG